MHNFGHDRGRQAVAPAAGATRPGKGAAGQRRMPMLPAAVVPLLIAALAGCGASSSSGSPAASGRSGSAGRTAPAGSTAPAGGASSPAGGATPASSGQSGPVTPGHGSPADAVDGYYQALLAGNATVACSYLLGDVGSCPATMPAGTGHFTIVSTAESGALAMVAVTGQICFSGGCMSNSNPAAGMPSGSESVSQAFADATVTGSSNALSPVTCEESSHGGWYIAVNGG